MRAGRAIVLASSWVAATTLFAAETQTTAPTAVGKPNPQKATRAKEKGGGAAVVITAKPWLFNRQTRYAHSLPEVNGATITVTKKATVVELANQPTIIDNNQRELNDRLPGIVLAEQQNPTQLNISYRGLGNPQESEYVLLLQDGVPMELDWIGYPTVYYLPVPQTIASVQMIRAGSSLLYGPEPEPAINFISRPPADRAVAGTTEQVGGSRDLWSSFNEVSGSSGSWSYLADYARRQSSGERANGGYTLDAGDLHLGYGIDGHRRLAFDLRAYALGSGLAGLMSYAQFAQNAEQTTTPADHLWSDRYTAVVTFEDEPNDRTLFKQLIWTGYQNLTTRSDTYATGAPGAPAAASTSASAVPVPTSASLSSQSFDYSGLDGRWRTTWGAGNALTLGYTAYLSHSPYDIWHDPNPFADRDDMAGALFYREDRRTRYGAVFAESLFRLPHRIHVVLSARFDHEELATSESVAPHADLADSTYRKSVPLFGFGIGNDFGHGNETYFNVSQAFRPLRYLDIASPFTNFADTNNPNPTRFLEYEAGVHGWPLLGFYYDASVFQIDARDRIESQALTQVESIDVNTGDTRSRGVELESSYDVLRLAPQIGPAEHLDVFLNAQLLQARFTASAIPGQVGKTPAYAPSYLYKAGITWRREPRWKVSLVMESVGSQYFQDSDAAVAGTPARIPAYVVADLATDVYLTKHLRFLGGVSNIADRRYYSRVFISGGRIEPALGRALYAGAAYDF